MVSQTQTMQFMSFSQDTSDLPQLVVDIMFSMRLEILMFASAVAGYLLLFSSRVPQDLKRLKLKTKVVTEDNGYDEPKPKKFEIANANLCRAVEAGDHRAVVRSWNAIKQFERFPTVDFSHVVESMQCVMKDSQFIIREVKAFLKKYPDACGMPCINNILEPSSKRLDSQFIGLVLEMLPSLDMKPDERTYAILLAMHATTRSFPEVQRVLTEMETNEVALTSNAKVAVIKAALQTGNFQEAHKYFAGLKASWDTNGRWEAEPWPLPRHILSQFIEVACREHQLQLILPDLSEVPLSEEAINSMLSHSIRASDSELAKSIEALARSQNNLLPDSTYALLVKGLAGRPWRLKAVVKEIMSHESANFSPDLAFSLLDACAKIGDKETADSLWGRMQPKQFNVVSAFLRFYIESEQLEKACDIFEDHLQAMQGGDSQKRLMIDSRLERSLMSAALQCGRTSLVRSLSDSSRGDVAKHIIMIRRCASEKNLKGAVSLFESLEDSGVELNSIIYNTVLDACVKCNDLKSAEDWMKKIQDAGMADVVTFNTLIKAHCMAQNFKKAREMMSEMRELGLQPNRVTYNEVLNAIVAHGGRHGDIWEVVKEMKSASISPNQVTCSILLKTVSAKTSERDIVLTMDLIDGIDEPLDEVLLSSVVEACVRIGKPDLLAKKLEDLQGKNRIAVIGSHTFGSLIKAYGHAKDAEGVWRCWKDMRSRLIKPTSITLGCMVEAVVNNGDTEGAFDLIRQIQQDEQCRDAVNSVIYCSILKGFSREKKLERVWEVYEEMSARNMEMSLITFNTIIDACARVGRMDELSKVMDHMKKCFVEPNLITFSTIVKGYCHAGDIQRGFSVLSDMQRDTNLKPDEIMYNSLLDGCAQSNLYDEAVALLADMQKANIAPSNFTLSIMVKLFNRCGKVEPAFDLVRDLSKKYKFKPNVHVYTNLIQACIGNRQPDRALAILETMIKERVQPDFRLFNTLIRSSMYQHKYEQAAALLRAALGLPQGYTVPGANLMPCQSTDSGMVNEALTNLLDRGCAQTLVAPLIADIKHHRLRVSLDHNLQRRVTSVSPTDSANYRVAPKGCGKKSACPW